MQISFSVGAKAARLIGRENIADVDGALIELIKNAYDADASCVWVNFSMPFPDVPDIVKIGDLKKIMSAEDLTQIPKYYKQSGRGQYEILDGLTNKEKSELQALLFKYNRLLVLDNGSGMNEKIVRSSWMKIGTTDKETVTRSPKGRVKTGAKGIGRFALDKLSRISRMYTAQKSDSGTLYWQMNWDQFASAELLEQVNAELNGLSETYEDIVKKLTGDAFKKLETYGWASGTAFILSPTREVWNDRLFTKVNTNLASINPMGNADKFDVIVRNEYKPKLDYCTKNAAIDPADYDYKIIINYTGDSDVRISLERNEIDLKKQKVKIEEAGKKKYALSDFWNRPPFQKKNYTKEDYGKTITIIKNIYSLVPKERKEQLQDVGPFCSELYFLRGADGNNGYELMKRIVKTNRKKLSDQFSGIKIYRDEFKVRPYGDAGPMYDWLELGPRGRRTSFTRGHWRVQPNQLIGFVKITRDKNPMLEDMANREGLAQNNVYYAFTAILKKCLEIFEYDREYVYREYDKWKKEQITNYAKQFSATQQIKDMAANMLQNADTSTNSMQNAPEKDRDTDEQKEPDFTKQEYLKAVRDVMEESRQNLNAAQIQQILSLSGITLNTFFHEFNALNTQFHVRASQLRSRINYLLGGKDYVGLPAYDPYKYIQENIEKKDQLMAAILDVIMEGLKKPNLVRQTGSLILLTQKILGEWKILLEEKYIYIEPLIVVNEAECFYDMAVVDWYIILNNFLLNSAWFLEQGQGESRIIRFSFEGTKNEIHFIMENNGPGLSSEFADNTDIIFELGKTSKKNGTGIGLWAVRETVERYGGRISNLERQDGFALEIVLSKDL